MCVYMCIYIYVLSSEPLWQGCLTLLRSFPQQPPGTRSDPSPETHKGASPLNSRHEVRASASGPPAARRKPRHLADGMSKLCQAIRGLAEPVRLSEHDWHLMIISIGVCISASTSACADGAANLPSTGHVNRVREVLLSR